MRDWQVNRLAPRGQPGECASRVMESGAVRLSRAGDAALVGNVSPNLGAAVTVTAALDSDGKLALRLCNTGEAAVRWENPPVVVVVSELP